MARVLSLKSVRSDRIRVRDRQPLRRLSVLYLDTPVEIFWEFQMEILCAWLLAFVWAIGWFIGRAEQ